MSSPVPTNSDQLKRQQFKKKNLYTIFITNIIHGFGFSMFNVVYQPYLFQITQSEIILGYLATFGMLMQLLPMQISGKLADKYGRKPIILIGLSMIATGILIIGIFQEKKELNQDLLMEKLKMVPMFNCLNLKVLMK